MDFTHTKPFIKRNSCRLSVVSFQLGEDLMVLNSSVVECWKLNILNFEICRPLPKSLSLARRTGIRNSPLFLSWQLLTTDY